MEKTYEAIVVDGENVLLLGNHVAEAAASGILEGNAAGLGPQNLVDVIAIVELVIEALGDLDRLRRISVLHNDEMIGLEKGAPHLQEIEVPYRRNHDVQLVLQQRRRGCHC